MSDKVAMSLLTQGELDAISRGDFVDIFSVLGQHRSDANSGIVLRAFLPWAETVDVYNCSTGKKVTTLKKVHVDGIYETLLKNRKHPFDYYFVVNRDIRIDDPYRFSSLLNEMDLYLFSEGTGEYVYQWMGAHQRSVGQVDGVCFTLWAPAAKRVSVVGDFNGWDGR